MSYKKELQELREENKRLHNLLEKALNQLIDKNASSTFHEPEEVCVCSHQYQAHAKGGGACIYAKGCDCKKFNSTKNKCQEKVKLFYGNVEYEILCGNINPISKNIVYCKKHETSTNSALNSPDAEKQKTYAKLSLRNRDSAVMPSGLHSQIKKELHKEYDECNVCGNTTGDCDHHAY